MRVRTMRWWWPVAGLLAMAAVCAMAAGPGLGSGPAGAATSGGGGNTTTTAGTSSSALPEGHCAGATGSPGVSAHKIVTDAILTRTGALAGDSAPLVYGVQAYFDMVNAAGGINGRKLILAHAYDDESNPSQFSELTHTAVNQDHAFAISGVASIFFSPEYLVQTCTPTYGYNLGNSWAGPPNLFGTGGSVLSYQSSKTQMNFLARKLKVKRAALISYGVTASAAECKAVAAGFKQIGVNVAYEDLDHGYGASVTPDVQRMSQDHVDFVFSCMADTDNISLSRAMDQYGMGNVKQLWLSGNDLSLLHQYPSLMSHVYFFIQHVPFTAAAEYPGVYPGLQTYIKEMNKYEPKYTYDEVALQGWESAALFAAGVKAAGNDLTQKNVVDKTNQFTNFTAGGLTAVTNWKDGGHVPPPGWPACGAFIKVKGKNFYPVFGQGHQVFVCVDNTPSHPVPVKPPAGTPGT